MSIRGRFVDVLLYPFRRLAYLVFWSISLREVVCEVEVADFLACDEIQSRIPLVREALVLLGSWSPVVLHRLQDHLRGIVISESRTAYMVQTRTCVLNADALDRYRASEVALLLTHEVTHAVIEDAGIPYRGALRERIEHACVRAELRLARRLGDQSLVDWATEKLNTVWWEEAQVEAVREREWREIGIPEWLIRMRRTIKGRG